MLTAGEITRLVDSGDIAWTGDLRGDGLLLRLGSPLQPLVGAIAAGTVDLADQASIDRLYQPPRSDWDTFDLRPGQLVLCQAAQPLRLSCCLAGAIGTLSHLARVGLATHVTSPWVLPGWDGHLTLELLNVGPAPLRVRTGMPVARLLIFNMDGPIRAADAHPFYGGRDAHLGSRYATEFSIDEYRQ
jgi:deoxycytidine triphosphate deaminase